MRRTIAPGLGDGTVQDLREAVRGEIVIAAVGFSRLGGTSRPSPGRPPGDSRREPWPHVLNPDRLSDHIDQLYRAAWALCGSRHDAEDLVQETLAAVLKRPRLIRNDNEIGYLMRALRNTYASWYRSTARRRTERPLSEDDVLPVPDDGVNAREIMEAIASAPALYRDAVIAVDLLGLSYREAARSLRTREATITTRLYRGRRHVARELINEVTEFLPAGGIVR